MRLRSLKVLAFIATIVGSQPAEAQLVKNSVKVTTGDVLPGWTVCILGCTIVQGGTVNYYQPNSASTSTAQSVDSPTVSLSIEFAGGTRARYYAPKNEPVVRMIDGIATAAFHALGSEGLAYGLLIRNDTPERKAVCIAVDGANVVNGAFVGDTAQALSYSAWSTCYLAAPNTTIRIDGWRENKTIVRQFVMGRPENSLATALSGRAERVGTIVLAVFDDEEARWSAARQAERHERERERERLAAAEDRVYRRELPSGNPSLGTGYGSQLDRPTREEQFTPVARASSLVSLQYGTEEHLRRLGVIKGDGGNYITFPPVRH